MDRFAPTQTIMFGLLLGLMTTVGCGSKAEIAENSPATNAAVTNVAATSSSVSPMDIVSQFLDEVRRGGDNTNANGLLTVRAREELTRIGTAIQPIGSPDASFTVTRAELVPDEPNSALVHSIWSEPSADGKSSNLQVVWAVEKEPVGWRISGLAMELEPGAAPVIIDFENAEMMASLLAPPAPDPNTSKQANPTENSAQAAVPTGEIAR